MAHIFSEPDGHSRHSWHRLILVDLFLLALLILSTRLATFLHELIGHGLTAVIFGGRLNGIRLTLFGGGNAYYHFQETLTPFPGFLVAFGGILINLLSGLLALRSARAFQSRHSWALFLTLFAMVSLLGGLTYASLGFYYEVGDPVAWMKEPPPAMDWHWIPFLFASALAAYFGIGRFFRLMQPWHPVRSFPAKAVVLALTLGVTAGAYAGLYALTRQRSMALESPSLADMRAQEKIREEKKAAIYSQLKKAHPEWTDQETRRQVERTPVVVRPEEVPRKPPLILLLALFQITGALLALRKTEEIISPSFSPVSAGALVLSLVLAACVIGFLAWTGGWIYGSSGIMSTGKG
ncbi:MAG: M50 family metallopeptidase [Deltaproteobacteria bacterium]|nr:M50 family metallopeptidase [Deltaproteobacteria bacterium]